MTLDFASWMRAVWFSLMEPTKAAENVLKAGVPVPVLWMVMGLTSVLTVLILAAMQWITPLPAELREQGLDLTPFALVILVGFMLSLFVYAVHIAGKMMGSPAGFPACLAIMAWFNWVNVTLEGMQVALALISPSVAAMFSVIAFGVMLWCLLNFLNVLHGFGSMLKAAASLFLALVMLALIGAVVLTFFGVTPGVPA